MPNRWLSVSQAADEYFHGKVMRVYRRIWAGDITASNEAIAGDKAQYRISERAIEQYFESRTLTVPARRMA